MPEAAFIFFPAALCFDNNLSLCFEKEESKLQNDGMDRDELLRVLRAFQDQTGSVSFLLLPDHCSWHEINLQTFLDQLIHPRSLGARENPLARFGRFLQIDAIADAHFRIRDEVHLRDSLRPGLIKSGP